MATPINSILIVGGGTAGWLTATILASKHRCGEAFTITVVEAPDIPIIGVGEGTWPGLRATLQNAGIEETDFLRTCDASFKQGSLFVGWKNGHAEDSYSHPFDLPQDFFTVNLAQDWIDTRPSASFSKFSCVQEHLGELDLSPKLKNSRSYSGVVNYGYHLNAGKFSEFLKQHCTEKLGVKLVVDKVTDIIDNDEGDIAHVLTAQSGALAADLFVDCTGFKSLLLGQHCGVDFIDQRDKFPIDSALAVQVPYGNTAEEIEHAPIKSSTIATAQEAGWVWDIGLSSRRGVGHLYSSKHISHEKAAAQLQDYLNIKGQDFDKLGPRKITINPGYREKFWHRNCVAIGLSAGFLEPLEASSIMLTEASANMIADQMPANRDAMEVLARRFNKRFEYRWQRVIDFLQLHYALSERQEPFWREASSSCALSERLREDLSLWKHQAPWKTDFDSLDEAFPVASYQYVLYGMGFDTQASPRKTRDEAHRLASNAKDNVARNASVLKTKVESNRALLNNIKCPLS